MHDRTGNADRYKGLMAWMRRLFYCAAAERFERSSSESLSNSNAHVSILEPDLGAVVEGTCDPCDSSGQN